MKEKLSYESPVLELFRLKNDVIATSGCKFDCDCDAYTECDCDIYLEY